MPGTVVGSEELAVNETDKVPPLWDLRFRRLLPHSARGPEEKQPGLSGMCLSSSYTGEGQPASFGVTGGFQKSRDRAHGRLFCAGL